MRIKIQQLVEKKYWHFPSCYLFTYSDCLNSFIFFRPTLQCYLSDSNIHSVSFFLPHFSQSFIFNKLLAAFNHPPLSILHRIFIQPHLFLTSNLSSKMSFWLNQLLYKLLYLNEFKRYKMNKRKNDMINTYCALFIYLHIYILSFESYFFILFCFLFFSLYE